MIENLFEMIAAGQGIYDGTIHCFLVHAENLINADGKGTEDKDQSDPFARVIVPGGSRVESNVIKDQKDPVWK
jgi:hypothetical protein